MRSFHFSQNRLIVDMDDVLKKIDRALKERGLSDAAASKLAVDNFSLIKNMRKSRSDVAAPRYNYQSLQKLADVLGLELYFGPPRETAPVDPALIDGTHFAAIPRLEAQVAAGSGRENGDDAATIGHLAFSHKWLQKMGVLASQACLVTVDGDSMAPTLRSGALVLIDERRTNIRNRRIYALTDEDGMALVKRLELIKGETLVLHSDNPEHETRLIVGNDMNRVTILGEIVWTGHQMDQAQV